ncbi:MAG TPA: DNA polymerase I [Nitrolancea sp.]|nr:DNA polymerase I [Nitrolancea sp.]
MTSDNEHAGRSIMLVDGYGLAFRAFHALPETLSTASGELTNAVFGFTSMLLDALREYQPDCVIVSFDVGRTFRHDSFDGYKAQRAPMPETMRGQMDRIFQTLEVLNIPIYTKEGFEADDVIGTLARRASSMGMHVYIVTGDSDLLQLVDGDVKIVLPGRQRFGDYRVYDRAAVIERYKFDPERIPEYKALVGDTSDNIPGVPGVGAKTATTLIQTYASIEAMLEHIDEITPARARNSLKEHADQALEGRRLATIVQDVDLDLDLDNCVWGTFDRNAVIELFRTLEFRTLVNKLPDPITRQVAADPPPRVEAVRTAVITPEQLAALVEDMKTAEAIALDVETTGLDPMRVDLVGIAIATSPERSYYIPLLHVNHDGLLDKDDVRDALSPIFASSKPAIYAHNGKYDAVVMEQAGYPRLHITFDTMIAAYLLGETSLGLKDLAFKRLGMEMTEITELIGRGRTQLTMDQTEVLETTNYACADVEATYQLVELLRPELVAQQQVDLFNNIEIPLIDVLMDMEETGIAVDVELLESLSHQLAAQIAELEAEIYRLAGGAFNINSTKQLGKILFEDLNLPTGRRTKTGYSVSQDVLEGLRDAHPMVSDILEYRQLLKLKSTYVDALPAQVNPRTGRIHTSYNQTIAATGRLSSTDPNLQNIPVRTGIGRSVRRAFIADNRPDRRPWDEEAIFLSADYSQIELRLMAHLSEDEMLVKAFREGQDIHAATAADVFGVPLKDVTSDMRRVAKTVNFGIMYGMQAFGLSRDTGMSRQEAQEFINRYMARLPGVRDFLERTKQEAARKGYVESMFGRRRYVPEITSSNFNVRLGAERIAINMPLQGSAADIMKMAMIQVHRALKEQGFRGRILLQVHDELLFELPRSELEPLGELAARIMEHVVELRVPLGVERSAGPNWDQLEPV